MVRDIPAVGGTQPADEGSVGDETGADDADG